VQRHHIVQKHDAYIPLLLFHVGYGSAVISVCLPTSNLFYFQHLEYFQWLIFFRVEYNCVTVLTSKYFFGSWNCIKG
jgi:hypothetical protein